MDTPLVALLQKLISFHTVDGDSKAEHRAFEFIAGYLKERGMFVQIYTFGRHEALIATVTPNHKTPTVMLAAHLDVVPGTKELFTLRERDGKLYGRGVNDMKFAVACYLQLVDDLQDELTSYDFGIMITADEEQGVNNNDINGTRCLVEDGYQPRVAVLPDGGDNWQIEEFAKGTWQVELQASGRTAHGSRPWEGDNAAEHLIDALQEIRALFVDQQPHGSTLTIAQLGGGEAINQIPATATAGLDIRVMSHEALAAIKDDIEAICHKHRIDIQLIATIPPCKTDLTNPFVRDFMTSVQTITGQLCEASVSYGASDAPYFNMLGIPCILCKPTGGNHHGAGEWLDTQALHDYKDVLIDYLKRVLNEPAGLIENVPQEALTE